MESLFSGSSEGLILKGQIVTRSEEKKVGQVWENKGIQQRSLYGETDSTVGGVGGIGERKKVMLEAESGQEAWRRRDKMVSEKDPQRKKPKNKSLRLWEPLHLCLIICLLQWVFESNFAGRQVLAPDNVWKPQKPTQISIPFNYENFWAIVVQFNFNKIKHGNFKSSP